VGDRESLLCPDGTAYDVAVSSLIKTLRRGLELDAAYWAEQLSERYQWKVWRILEVFAAEDVGVANPLALPQVVAGRIAWEHHQRESKAPPPIVLLVSSVLMLARSPKSREADDLTEVVKHLRERGWAAQVHGFAVDAHTAQGRAEIPREERLARWLSEGRTIVPDEGPKDWHAAILRWAVLQGSMDGEQVEAQIAQWAEEGRLVHGPDGYGSASW
jgi:hypothetical protein